MNPYRLVKQLTSPTYPEVSTRMLAEFAREFGWRPSDRIVVPSVSKFANAHLAVEHGLENTAVISFLRGRTFGDLDYSEQVDLLSISYNNMVDWHIHVHEDKITYVNNRVRNRVASIIATCPISERDTNSLRVEAFEQISDQRVSTNIRALDDALIETISHWKRHLSAEADQTVTTAQLSAFFNSIIFVRAAEDNLRRYKDDTGLLFVRRYEDSPGSFSGELLNRIKDLVNGEIPSYIYDLEAIRVFDKVDKRTMTELLHQFYDNKFAPYQYDFSLISKQALSRIYEKYVSLLKVDAKPYETLSLFPPIPNEEKPEASGSVYTPQFIARFFARFLREDMSPTKFRNMRSIDPSCGSGIFLRTLLELQCDPVHDGVFRQIDDGIMDVVGLDNDPNACAAASLSLALLHLVLTSKIPSYSAIKNEEAISYLQSDLASKASFDSVIANPPFVSADRQTVIMRQTIADYMGEDVRGKADAYVAFVKIALDILKPGGYGCFVLPQAFFINEATKRLRKKLQELSWIRCVVDLTQYPVFSEGVYVMLLIFQKRSDFDQPGNVKVLKCRDHVSQGLQELLDGGITSTRSYDIFEVPQTVFQNDKWNLSPSGDTELGRKITSHPTLGSFLAVRTGFISGADSVFSRIASDVPIEELQVYVKYLSDKSMEPYALPSREPQYFFSPYVDGQKLTEAELIAKFPQTYEYLKSNKSKLEDRLPVKKGQRKWWEPHRPVMPAWVDSPKILAPHLMIVPKFFLDLNGDFVSSHTPFITSKREPFDTDLLKYCLGILNSSPCYWYMVNHFHKYRAGYIRLETTTLKQTPIPDPETVDSVRRKQLIDLVDQRLSSVGRDAFDIEAQIDEIVAEFYGLSNAEKAVVGIPTE